MSEYKHKEMLKSAVGDLISNTVLYDHETREPLNLEEVDAEYRRTIGEIDEVYAKAKAFDEIREARKEVLTDVRERGLKLPTDLDKFSMMTERIIKKYESGETDAKK